MRNAKLQLQIKNELSELQRIRVPLDRFYAAHQLTESTIYAFDLSLDEILTNIILHAESDKEALEISISINLTETEIVLLIEDDGYPFDPLSVPDPDVESDLASRPVGGLGLYLVKKFVDDVQYRHSNGRNCLTLRKIRK